MTDSRRCVLHGQGGSLELVLAGDADEDLEAALSGQPQGGDVCTLERADGARVIVDFSKVWAIEVFDLEDGADGP